MSAKMYTGWMWQDNDASRTLEQKVKRAAAAYAAKFGRRPDTCYVRALDNGDLQVDGVEVLAARHVLPHHFWLGVADG